VATSKRNKVRIGGGAWRSRLLRFPDALGLRPTPDRVRQTLFNWLGQEMQGRVCLDLFAGSGALGFEALSRGADEVVMVEQAFPVFRALQENAQLLQAQKLQLYRADALQFLAQNTQHFDVIFLDPPFGQGWLEKLLPHLPQQLVSGGLVYAEAETVLADSDVWRVLKHGKAGSVHYHLLQLADV
jgi:16S rRNA (guanine(966)-N(2))-methyltransferase RsmD